VFADERLDIRHARIATLGDNVVDTFYVRESSGELITDEHRRSAITKRILEAVV
jgi:[protein-PII] uridylyltransferase